MSDPRPRPLLLALTVLGVLAVAGLHVAGLDGGLLFLAPAIALLLPLLAGRYLGERRLVPAPPARRLRAAVVLQAPRPPAVLVPRGGLLVGCALAGRAPPR